MNPLEMFLVGGGAACAVTLAFYYFLEWSISDTDPAEHLERHKKNRVDDGEQNDNMARRPFSGD